jgi:hypothetical protein
VVPFAGHSPSWTVFCCGEARRLTTISSTLKLYVFVLVTSYTDMRRLTTVIRSEKCVSRRFCRCAKVYLQKPRYVL